MKTSPTRFLRNAFLLTCMALSAGPTLADSAAAARYYEDGLARFQREDLPGAVIQLKNALQQDRDMLAAHLLLARAYFAQGDTGPAEVEFREAIRLGVNRTEIAVPLASVYMLQGRPALLLSNIDGEGLPPAARAEVLVLRGKAYAALGRLNEAGRSFSEARALDPTSPLPLAGEVPILLTAGQNDLAAERARRAVELDPQSAAAYNARASVAHATGNLADALRDYERAIALQPALLDARVARAGLLLDLGRTAEAGADLDKLTSDAPNEPRIAYLRALVAERGGDTQTAIAHFTTAAQQIDALSPEWLAGQEQMLMAGALAHRAAGRAEKTRSYLDVLIARYPRNLGARRLLAAVMIEAGDDDRARELLEPMLRKQPDDAQTLYLLGRLYLTQKRYAKAAELLERATQLGNADPRLQSALGFSRIGLGDSETGLRSLDTAFSKNPSDLGLALALANLRMRRGERDQALAVARKAVAAAPANPFAHNLLGLMCGGAGDLAGARAAYTEALQRDPAFTTARLNLARIDSAEGHFDAARKIHATLLAADRRNATVMYEAALVEQRAGNAAEALRWFAKAYAEQPDEARFGLALADAQRTGGDTQRGLDTARQLAARLGNNLGVLAALAKLEMDAGETRAAQQTLHQMARIAEYDVDAQIRIGYLQLNAGAANDAALNARKALQGRPGDAAGLILAAEAAISLKDFDKATERVQELRSRYPNRIDALRLGGDIDFARGQFAAADNAWRQAQERQPSSAIVLRRVRGFIAQGRATAAEPILQQWLRTQDDPAARHALGEIYLRTGNWQAARREYQTWIDNGATDANVYNNLAYTLLRLGDHTAALTTAQKAHALTPADAGILDTLGWALAQNGRTDEALRHLREARLRAPENAEIRWHLGYLLAKQGQTEEARAELDNALRPGSDFHGIEEARQLRKLL